MSAYSMADATSAYSAADAQVIAAMLSLAEKAIEAKAHAVGCMAGEGQTAEDAIIGIGAFVMESARDRITANDGVYEEATNASG